MPKFNVHRVRFFEYLPQAIHCLAFDNSKNRLALSRADHSVEIWSLDSNWFQEKVIRNSEDSSIEGLVWANGRLFSAGLCCDVSEYDLCSLQIKQSTPSYSGAVWCLTCNSEQTRLAAGTEEGCVTIFDIEDGDLKFVRSFDKQEGRILCVSWSRDGELLVTGSADTIRLWSYNSGRAKQRLTLQRLQRQKEVLVWCVAVTRDLTIISGDSCGRTIFWNGKQGTQTKCFTSHLADVQTLCVDESGTRVFSSGVDPKICQFDLTPLSESSDLKRWVITVCKAKYTHDVRALALTRKHLVAGGVDAYLAHAELTTRGTGPIRQIHPVPQEALVSVSTRGLVLLQYPSHLELWKLGQTDSKSDVAGTILPLSSRPVKLAVLRAKDGEHVVCSSLSDDVTWLAYADHESVRIFSLDVDLSDLFEPRVTLTRVRYRPPGLESSHRLLFSRDSRLLVSATPGGDVQVIRLDQTQPTVVHTFPHTREPVEPVYLLSLSHDSRTLVTVSHHNDVQIHSLEQKKTLGTLPRAAARVTAVNVSSDGATVLVAYADRKVLEYDARSCKFTDWTRKTIDQWPRPWLNSQSAIRNVQYNPANQEQVLLQGVTSFALLDKSLPFPSLQKAKKNKRRKEHIKNDAFKVCTFYKLMLHAELLPDNWLVVVERPTMTLLQALPDALQRKKFGT